MKMTISCDWCGKPIDRYPSQIKDRNFCSRGCQGKFNGKATNPEGYGYRSFEKNSKRMTEMNRELNSDRMMDTTRSKLREARLGAGEGKAYAKQYGRHEHRVVAEQILGRALEPGEVVHHIDGNKRNNSPENLMVFENQAQHAAWHQAHRGGDAV